MGKRGPYAKGRVRREEILQRGLEVIAEDGYDAASVTRIAQAAGLSKTGLLHYFGSKEKLLTEILRKRDEVDDPQLDERRASLTELEAAYMRVVSRNAGIPGMVELFSRLSVEAVDPEHPAHEFFVRRDHELGSRIARSIARTEKSESSGQRADLMALILLAATDGLQLRWLRDPDIDMTAALRALFELFDAVSGDTP